MKKTTGIWNKRETNGDFTHQNIQPKRRGKPQIIKRKAVSRNKRKTNDENNQPKRRRNIEIVEQQKGNVKKRKATEEIDGENRQSRGAKRRKFQHITENEKDAENSNCSEARLPYRNFANLSDIWRMLTVRGPYSELYKNVQSNTLKNRKFFNLNRRVFYEIYKKSLQFREEEIPEIFKRSAEEIPPTSEQVMFILDKMCATVFRIQLPGNTSSSLYEYEVLEPIERVFSHKKAMIEYGKCEEIKRRLKKLCKEVNVAVTEEELDEFRNMIEYYILYLSGNLINHLLVLTPQSGDRIKSFRHKVKRMESFFTGVVRIENFAQIKCISHNAFQRRKSSPSLWLSLPCEEKEHLLEWVFEYGLINALPESAKNFLDSWISGVQKRMRKRLVNGDLRTVIESVLEESDPTEEISLDDDRIEQFIIKIMDNVFTSKNFDIFKGCWQECIIRQIKETNGLLFDPGWPIKHIVEDVCEKMNPSAFCNLSAMFEDTPEQKCLFNHTILQLLRFAVLLSCHTIRHVFHYDKETRRMTYDGEFDQEVTNFEAFESSKKIDLSPVSEATPNVVEHVIRPRKTLLPTPSSIITLPSVRILPGDFVPTVPPPSFGYPFGASPVFPPADTIPSSTNIQPHDDFYFEELNREKKSFLYTPINPNPIANLMPEVTEEELSNARALRTSSIVSGSILQEDEEDVPKKWINAYKLTSEWNQDLKEELERVKARLDRVS